MQIMELILVDLTYIKTMLYKVSNDRGLIGYAGLYISPL